ncbi:redoxin family protein [Salinimonas sp. HHU 13199]|uniref:Redoxin family protein n=1 Tax=Salinimonas profundi TaxID=2729140 RepID=A0ABR8LRM2_9ALTE|nr:redoxin domain-containing protein [Salinimonas profundi]MBD3586584.1 redoxin family protein [Salinimonas profundi]
MTQPTFSQKLQAGSTFPDISVTDLHTKTHVLGQPGEGKDWQLVVVYRGQHCPICTKYLNKLQKHKNKLMDTGVDIIAVSADSKEQLESHLDDLSVDFTLGYGLTEENMKALGVYISDPRSEKETDHPFAEPALFVVDQSGIIRIIDISNAPFSRPDVDILVDGLQWLRKPDNDYPVRGTHA